LQEILRVPLTPVKIDAFLLYHLFELLYPRFINDQQNILDLFISDYEIDNIVFGLYLYKTSKPGIHSAIKELPKDSIVIEQDDLTNIPVLFKKLQDLILKEHGVKISCIRVIKKRGIDLINSHSVNLKKLTTFDFIESVLDLIQIVLKNDLFFIYPEPNVLCFFKNLVTFLKGLRLSKVYQFLNYLLPPFNTLIIINSSQLPIALKLKKQKNTSQKPNLNIKLAPLEVEKYNFNSKTQTADFRRMQLDFEVDRIIILNQNLFLQFLTEVFEEDIPPTKENLRLMFQKVLFGIRSYNLNWKTFPKLKMNNILLRFLTRLIGINFNINKLSHWAIPDFIFGLSATYLGLNANTLVILTNRTKNNLKKISTKVFHVKIENGSIKRLDYITTPEIISKISKHSLESIRLEMFEELGFISNILMVDIEFIKALLKSFLIEFHKISLFSLLKIIKLLKNPKYFQMYPEIPPYNLLKKRRTISFLKDLLAIVIDKHEF
jgi:hypothetical protein